MKKIIVLAALLLTSVASGGWFTDAGGDPASLAGSNGGIRASSGWSSGWVDIAPGETKTFTHNLGENPDYYAVDLWYRDTDPGGLGINHRAYGGFEDEGKFYGVAWQNLTDTTIKDLRYADDTFADQILVRIWIPDPPDYDSGWVDIQPLASLSLTHNLGGNVDDYTVGMKFKDTRPEGAGINLRCAGGLEADGMDYGAIWDQLTSTMISVFRYPDDVFADQVRVFIYRPDPPDYDSGWVDIAPGQAITLTHNLGGSPMTYIVRASAKSARHGVNTWFAGGFEADGQFFGSNWEKLTSSTIRIFRQPDDGLAQTAEQVRVRIWRREFKVYLPIIMKN